MPFEEAREIVRKLNLKNITDWQMYTESGSLPPDIPKTPFVAYKDEGWKGLGDWLGTDILAPINREYLSFDEARTFARSLQLKKPGDWRIYCKSGLKPDDIPAAPEKVHEKQGWAGLYDWLDIESNGGYRQGFLPYEQAREFVHTLRLKKTTAWTEWCRSGKRPANIPTAPKTYYKDKGWIDWRDWLGPL